ncbi:hypothetical protein SRHO_G00202080 [Serrasalmus rhombeus]
MALEQELSDGAPQNGGDQRSVRCKSTPALKREEKDVMCQRMGPPDFLVHILFVLLCRSLSAEGEDGVCWRLRWKSVSLAVSEENLFHALVKDAKLACRFLATMTENGLYPNSTYASPWPAFPPSLSTINTQKDVGMKGEEVRQTRAPLSSCASCFFAPVNVEAYGKGGGA